jgi:TonB-linked SusC/RagA family outer membrane protein
MKAQLLMLLMLLSLASYGQNLVTGKVTDEKGEGLPGVTIAVKGTSLGVITDAEGQFTLQNVPSDGIIVVSFIGYVSQELSVAGRTNFEIRLQEDVKALDELVVIGYGTAKVKELTGSVSAVGGEKLTSLNTVRVDQALQGQAAGVQVNYATGSPGGSANIRIRGFTTNGDNNPLILVDGIPYASNEGLNALNPSDIETISVLKDASAGIYGVRAANGVILITTKQGKRNTAPSIEFSGYYGIQETAKKLNLLNATEFAVLKNEMYAAAGLPTPYANVNLGKGTDWQDKVFGQAPIQNYNINVNGGSDKSTYSIGGSYLDQEGIVGGDKAHYKRYNGRLNFSFDILKNLTFHNSLMYTNETRNTLSENVISSVLYNAINASPIASVRTGDRYTYLDEVNDLINPLAQMENTFNEAKTNKIFGRQELVYKINENFELTGRAGYNYAIVDFKSFSPLVYYGAGKPQNTALNEDLDPVITTVNGQPTPILNSVNQSTTRYFDYNLEAFLNYNMTFAGVHKVKGTLGTSFINNEGRNLSGTAYNIPYNSNSYADISLADGNNLLNNTSSYQFISRLQSFFLRGEYSYKDKYLVSAVIRRDASSNFGPNNRFGYFPSASAAWVLSEESFFESNTIDFIKLRASYGVIGNDKIPSFAYRALLGGEGVYPFADQLVTGVAFGRLGNPDLKWETTHQTNIGVDLSLLEDKISVTTDYYIKNTKDLLYAPDISGVLGSAGAGTQPPFVNNGDVRNRGFEFLVTYSDKIVEGLNFSVSYNLTTIDNEMTALPVDFRDSGGFSVGGNTTSREQVGLPFGAFWGYKTEGVYQSAEEVTSRGVTQTGAVAGDLIYKDVNKDGTINLQDRTLIGSPIPNVIMGFNGNIDYKGFDFAFTLYTSLGNEIIRNYERQQPLANMLDYRIDRWTGAGSTNSDPRITAGQNGNNVLSDFFVEDGSFLRIKNLQLGYSLPASVVEKIHANKLRFYVAVNNLATFTKYKGYDPDFSSNSPLNSGIDTGYYPQARTYMAGFNLKF